METIDKMTATLYDQNGGTLTEGLQPSSICDQAIIVARETGAGRTSQTPESGAGQSETIATAAAMLAKYTELVQQELDINQPRLVREAGETLRQALQGYQAAETNGRQPTVFLRMSWVDSIEEIAGSVRDMLSPSASATAATNPEQSAAVSPSPESTRTAEAMVVKASTSKRFAVTYREISAVTVTV